MEMEEGGKLFFDLFVAMCNHIVCHVPAVDAFIAILIYDIKDDLGTISRSPFTR